MNQTIAILAFAGISPFHLSVPCMVFGEDRLHAQVPRFELLVCAAECGELPTNAGFSIHVVHDLSVFSRADMIIVPSWRDPLEMPPAELLAALNQARQRGAVIVGLCLGAFVLAAAGLLDDRSATTHWAWAAELQRCYPRVTVKAEVLYVDEGAILSSAGSAAGIDCCLHLLRRRHGSTIANCVARRLVVPPHRQGSQAQFIEQAVAPGAAADRFSQVLDEVLLHLEQEHSLDTLAQRALMSRRSFTRHFRQRIGMTVSAWLLNQRLALARRLLETTDKSMDIVAQESGLGSPQSLRTQFMAQLKTSPKRYRQEFRGARPT